MVAAEHERHRPLVERRKRRLIYLLADLGDVADVFLVLVAELLRFGNGRRKIALVDHRVTERRDLLAETGNAQRGRSHVDPPSSAAEVEGYADDVDSLHKVRS